MTFKRLHAVLVPRVVQQHEARMARSHECRNVKVIEPVDLLEVHGLRAPDELVDHV